MRSTIYEKPQGWIENTNSRYAFAEVSVVFYTEQNTQYIVPFLELHQSSHESQQTLIHYHIYDIPYDGMVVVV